MGRVFNAIELKPYYSRTADSAIDAARQVDGEQSTPEDFASAVAAELEGTEDPDSTEAPNPALPRWQTADG